MMLLGNILRDFRKLNDQLGDSIIFGSLIYIKHKL